MSKKRLIRTQKDPKTLSTLPESLGSQFCWKNSEEQSNGLIGCRGLTFGGSSPLSAKKTENLRQI
jgi:hypothetical protein